MKIKENGYNPDSFVSAVKLQKKSKIVSEPQRKAPRVRRELYADNDDPSIIQKFVEYDDKVSVSPSRQELKVSREPPKDGPRYIFYDDEEAV